MTSRWRHQCCCHVINKQHQQPLVTCIASSHLCAASERAKRDWDVSYREWIAPGTYHTCVCVSCLLAVMRFTHIAATEVMMEAVRAVCQLAIVLYQPLRAPVSSLSVRLCVLHQWSLIVSLYSVSCCCCCCWWDHALYIVCLCRVVTWLS